MNHAPPEPPPVQRQGQVSWQALPDWEPVLFGPKGLLLEDWSAEGSLRVVKHGSHRTVYEVSTAGRRFYVKRYRRDRLGDAVGHLVRPSAARRECHKAAEVARRGIATITPVAWSEQTRGRIVRDNYLVAEAIEPACSLDQCLRVELPKLPPRVQARARRRIFLGVARFVAAVHEAGIVHDDFHVGNVLVRLDTSPAGVFSDDRPPELYLIDVPGVRFSQPLSWRASRESLVMFGAGVWERATRTERLRFWRTYRAERRRLQVPDEHAALEQLARGTQEYGRRVARRRDRRTVRTNRDYVALGDSCGAAHGVADLDRVELGRLLQSPQQLLDRNLHRPVKLGHGKLIVEAELALDGGPVHVAYARYRYRNAWKAFLGRFRRGRALRGWIMGHALRTRGIATPRPIAVCRVRRPGRPAESYLATEWIEGSENLHLYGWRLARLAPNERLRRAARCAESLGRLIGRMHAWQLSHGDLKASNLLVTQRDGQPETYVIDAEDVRVARRLTWRARLRDLARLATGLDAHPWVTPAILCRFLRAYVRELGPPTIAWKPLWRAVARRARRTTERKRRRGRQVL